MSPDWFFPPSSGGSDDRFNDAGIETFAGARFDGLAREIIQNSLDATVDDDATVTVEFDCIKIAREDFPGRESLLKAMKQCEKESRDEKGKAFFGNAVRELKKAKIQCLKISDSGTTGLRGDYRERQGQWYAITKARGVSEKGNNATAGGSFGIGKNAPFAVSSLRTVFYSTLYNDDDVGAVYRAQGKSILMSHSMAGDEYTQATGFYGEVEGCLPIEGDIPDMLRPKEQGCVVFIPGFVAENQWQYKIMATVVSNFFYAIERKRLEVLIQDEKGDIKTIEKENLSKCFQKVESMKINLEQVKNSRHYYQAMQEPTSSRDGQLGHLGHCKMWVAIDEGLPKQVALLRKTGMLITDEQKGLKRWVGRADFVGVFMCDSDQGNGILREMENPQHNAFEPERAIPAGRRDKCRKALDELVDWVRESVDEQAKLEETKLTQIDELSEFFPDTTPPETIPGDEGERDLEGRPVYSPKPLRRPKPKTDTWEDAEGDEGGAGEDGGTNGDGPGDGSGQGDGTGGTGTRASTQPVELKNVRVVSDANKSRKKTVYFTPMKDGNIKIQLCIMGDDGGWEKIPVADTDGSSDSVFSVTAQRGERISLEATFDNPVHDSIAVRASQEKPGEADDETVTE